RLPGTPWTIRPSPSSAFMGSSLTSSISKQEPQVLRAAPALIQNDPSPRDLEGAVNPAQQVFALADEDVGLRLDAVPVDEEAALDGDLGRGGAVGARAKDLHVRDHVADARGRLLRPVDAGEDLLHAAGERGLALVEPVDVRALTRELALALVVRHVAPHRHPVADVLREQVEPVLVP